MQLTRRRLFYLGLLTLVGFSIIGFLLIFWFSPFTLEEIFSTETLVLQIWKGGLFGVSAALAGLWLIYHPVLKATRIGFYQIFASISPKWMDVIFISLCAGIGEEIFFRAALQPHIGVWPTAIVFIALHGYLDPRDWKVSIYGLLMVFISAGLGYLFEHYGIYASILAHAIFDWVIIQAILHEKLWRKRF